MPSHTPVWLTAIQAAPALDSLLLDAFALGRGDPGVIHENADGPELRHSLRDYRLPGGLVRNVVRDGKRGAAVQAKRGCDRLRVALPEIRQDDRGPVGREAPSGRLTDPARRTSDDRDLLVELHADPLDERRHGTTRRVHTVGGRLPPLMAEGRRRPSAAIASIRRARVGRHRKTESWCSSSSQRSSS
jgi:hypothetical protein